jgi:acyl-CoA thioesterase FadM
MREVSVERTPGGVKGTLAKTDQFVTEAGPPGWCPGWPGGPGRLAPAWLLAQPGRGAYAAVVSGRPPARHVIPGQVQWADTDPNGRVHFTAPFRWAEAAEHSLLRMLGHEFYGGFPRADVQATFHLPLGFEDDFEVLIGVQQVGRTSITYSWQVVSGEQICVTGSHLVVYVGDGTEPMPLPRPLRKDLEAMLD